MTNGNNIGVYTLDDAKDILTKAVDAVAGENKAYDLATDYILWVEENYWHQKYDKVNLQIASQAQKYIAKLRQKQIREKALAELLEERDALIDDCEANRAELGYSILEASVLDNSRNKYQLEIDDERNIKIQLDWEEVRAVGGSSRSAQAKDAYPVVDVKAWFAGNHNDRNITEQELEVWTKELVALLQDPVANVANIAMRKEKEVQARRSTYDAVTLFVNEWPQKKAQIDGYKNNVLSGLLIRKQIANITKYNESLINKMKTRAGDEVTAHLDPNTSTLD